MNYLPPEVEFETAPIYKFGDQELSDVVLTVHEQEFHCHKVILANSSEFFKALLYTEVKTAKSVVKLELEDIQPDTFRRLMELVYTGAIGDGELYLSFPKDYDEKGFLNQPGVYSRGVIVHHYKEDQQPQGDYNTNFWQFTGALLAAAERLKLTEVVKNYVHAAVKNDICCRELCTVCLNYWVFALQHKIDVPHNERKFTKEAFEDWFATLPTDCYWTAGPLLDLYALRIFCASYKPSSTSSPFPPPGSIAGPL